MKREDLLFTIKKVKDVCFDTEYICVILPVFTDKKEKTNEIRLFTSIGEVIIVDLDKIEVSNANNLSDEVKAVFNEVIEEEKKRYIIDLEYIKAYEQFNRLKELHNNNKQERLKLFDTKRVEIIEKQDYLTTKEVEDYLSNKLNLKEGYKVSVVDGLYNYLTYTHSINITKEIVLDKSYKDKELEKTELINSEFMKLDNINTNTFYLKSVINIDDDNELSDDIILFNNIAISFKRVNNTLNELNELVLMLNDKLSI